MATPSDVFVATTPIAQNQTNSATISMRWFVQHTEYYPLKATFRPLVNGEDAFRLLYNMMSKAKHTIDIICWGFQPSMYFLRDGKGMQIGKLLEQKGANDNFKVRLLCWHDALYVSSLSENNMPGYDVVTGLKQNLPESAYARMSLLSHDYQTDEERKFDEEWYWRANLNNVTQHSLITPPVSLAYDVAHSVYNRKQVFKNIDFATRDFGPVNRAEM
jgi:hypothetical protein